MPLSIHKEALIIFIVKWFKTNTINIWLLKHFN